MKKVKLRFKQDIAQQVLAGEHRVTLRSSNEAGLAPGEVGVTTVQGKPIYVRSGGWTKTEDGNKIAYELSLTPFPGQLAVREEHVGRVMQATTGMIPLVGPSSPIQALSVTVWGLNSKGEYAPIWRSSAVPLNQPMEALRTWIEQSAGLGQVEQAPPVPYAIIVTAQLRDGSAVLSYIRPSPPLAPPTKRELPVGLEPARISKRDFPMLVSALGRGSPNPLSRQLLSRTEEYRQTKKALAADGSGEDPYFVVLAQNVVPNVIPMNLQSKVEGHREVRDLWTKSEFVPSEVQEKKRRYIPRDIFDFVVEICKQVVCAPQKIRGRDLLSAELSKLLDEHGIGQPDVTDPRDVRGALVRLRAVYAAKDRMSVRMPQLEGEPPPFYSEISKLNPLKPHELEQVVGYAESKSAKRREEYAAELPRVFERISQEKSPQSWEYTRERIGELFPQEGSKGTWRPSARLPALSRFDLVSRVGPPDAELVRRGQESAWTLEETGVQRMPFEEPAARDLMVSQSELALDEALRVLGVQGRTGRDALTRTGRKRLSMQPSSALNTLHRKRRLSNYTPTPLMLRPQQVLILMSPVGAQYPRVMVYKHGTHIDADRVGKSPGELPELLGQAIQSTLFWLAEKGSAAGWKGRRRMTVFVGRVGHPYLFTALRPEDPLSVGQVSGNLARAAEGTVGYQTPAYTSNEERAGDIERYTESVRQQNGADAAMMITAGGPSVRRRAEAPTPPVAPSESFEEPLPGWEVFEDEERG